MAVALSFLPASLGLLNQGMQPLPLPQRLLAVALGLMLLEQAHMAKVDVQRVLAVRQLGTTRRLQRFTAILATTIVGEMVGFYLAAAGNLGLGMVLILVSLLGFNLLANGRFDGEVFQPAGPRHRLGVILVDCAALFLALLWWQNWGQLGISSLLLGTTLAYGMAKIYAYATGRASLAESSPTPSAIHVAYAAQQHPQPTQQNR
jgi:hypothetical protein